MTDKGWGTEHTPEEQRIDPSKRYRTRKGQVVINLQIVLHNSCGNEVTFPVKGTVVVRTKPLKTQYCIWTLDGRHQLFQESGLDLIPVE
mgnify:FL=1|jgi:hypothetical protein